MESNLVTVHIVDRGKPYPHVHSYVHRSRRVDGVLHEDWNCRSDDCEFHAMRDSK